MGRLQALRYEAVSAWPTPPAELRRAVSMLFGMRRTHDAIDEQLAIAVTLAPDRYVATLIAMRMAVHESPAIVEPTSSDRFQRWIWGWSDYRHCVGLLDDVAVSRHAGLDDVGFARWWECAS